MYKQVAKMVPVARMYEKQLLDEGTVDEATIKEMKAQIHGHLDAAYRRSKEASYKAEDWVTPQWESIKTIDATEAKDSGVPKADLRELGIKISTLPADKNFHRLVRKIFDQRTKCIKEGKGIDWGTGEALAFASLLADGFQVRISGQDVERGTFSHRHAHVFYQD